MRIRDDCLNDGVAPVGIGVRATITQGMVRQPFGRRLEVTFLFMKERLAISDEVLNVPELRLIDSRIVGLREDAIPKCKPDAAGCRVGGANPVLRAVSPSGLNAWLSESFVVVPWYHCA